MRAPSPHELAQLREVITEARARLTPYLSPEDDDKIWQDSIEGIVDGDPYDAIDRLVDIAFNAEAMGEAIKFRMVQLRTRGQRFEGRAEWARKVVLELLQVLGFRRLERAAYTATVSPGRAGVRITDLNLVPQGLVKLERRPLLLPIGEALRQGQDVPGAELANPQPTLSLRRV